MTTRDTRRPTWRRAVGLVAAATLAASGTALASNPLSADAAPKTPNVAKLAGPLAKQKINWETCDFGSDALNERLNKPNVQCATIKVPQDWHNPQNGKTWDIRISQAKNREVTDGRYKGTIFVNPGGPGGSGLPWGPVMQERALDLVPYYNFVGFDPRGVGQSSQTSCTYTWDSASTDPYAELKAAGKACSENEEVRTINTEQTAYDMDFIRYLLRAPKLSYIGYSYGTWLGAWYENLFGANGDKFLLDSSIDATAATLQPTWEEQPIARDRQFRHHMMNWIARHDDKYGLGTDPAAIHQRYLAASAKLDPYAVQFLWVFSDAYTAFPNNAQYPLAAEVVQAVIEVGESDDAKAESENPAADADAMLALMEKRANDVNKQTWAQARAELKPLAGMATSAQLRSRSADTMKTGKLDDVFDFVRCNDGQWTQGAAYWEKKNAQLSKKAPLSASWGLTSEVPVCAYWPTQNLMPVATDAFPKTVLLQGELDSQTGWNGARRAGVRLPNTSFIAIDNEGSHGHFPYGTEAVDRPIYNYFLKGKQPRNISVTQALPLPEETETYESWAKLNKKAKHTAGDYSDPWAPTAQPGARSTGNSVSDLLAQQEADQQAKRLVKEVYGDQGTRLLARN